VDAAYITRFELDTMRAPSRRSLPIALASSSRRPRDHALNLQDPRDVLTLKHDQTL